MSKVTQNVIGAVSSLWRYPVKSMQGEELATTQVKDAGLLGDRAYALLDNSDGKAATAKNPRKWPNLFAYRATFVEPPENSTQMPAVHIRLPDGSTVSSAQLDLNQALSKALKRDVTLAVTERGQVSAVQAPVLAAWSGNAEEYWPNDVAGLDYQDTVTDFALPAGMFFDSATILLLTTATLMQLAELYPQGRFAVQRFRPNIVVNPGENEKSFAENAWVGRTLAIGDQVRLSITSGCPRCVMTTLPQGDLPKDSGILRTAVQHNRGNVGVYATMARGGTIRRGDTVTLVD